MRGVNCKEMKQTQSIKIIVSDILTDLFGNMEEGEVFLPEDTIRRSVGGKKYSKHDLKVSQSWSAKSKGPKAIWVNCIGMTMTEFIKEHHANNIYFLTSSMHGFQQISIYRNKPEWETEGYVINSDKETKQIILHFTDILLVDEVITDITKETPSWLLEAPPNLYAAFTCKIYQGWRSLKKFDRFDWSSVWKTFKLNGYFASEDLKNSV